MTKMTMSEAANTINRECDYVVKGVARDDGPEHGGMFSAGKVFTFHHKRTKFSCTLYGSAHHDDGGDREYVAENVWFQNAERDDKTNAIVTTSWRVGACFLPGDTPWTVAQSLIDQIAAHGEVERRFIATYGEALKRDLAGAFASVDEWLSCATERYMESQEG